MVVKDVQPALLKKHAKSIINRQRYSPQPRRATLVKSEEPKASGNKRELFLDDLEQTSGVSDLDQMDNTNTNVSQMQGYNRRSSQLREMGGWFGNLDLSVDDFRDSVSRKLDQLNMSLQRPKVPLQGSMGVGILPPFASNAGMPRQLSDLSEAAGFPHKKRGALRKNGSAKKAKASLLQRKAV